MRSRRRRYRGRTVAGALTALLAVVFIGGVVAIPLSRTVGFLQHTVNMKNPVSAVRGQVAPPPGSIAWKLQHGQQVNILVLGYGGQENDSPWLSDTLMAVSFDPASHRIAEISIPRDLYVDIYAWPNGGSVDEKINTAFQVGNQPDVWGGGPLLPQYQGKDGPGHLVEATISRLTGLSFDGYVAVDFRAFRDLVDALGGIQVTMQEPLDDCHYPDYSDGYLNGGVPVGEPCPPGAGIHFRAGTYRVNGEQALEIARSRDAEEPDQASDFGRARRQQMILAAVRQRATSINGITKAPAMMDALQQDLETDLDLSSITAIYHFGAQLKDSSFIHLAVTDQNLVQDIEPYSGGTCGSIDAFALCPEDPTYRTWHNEFSHLFIDHRTLAEQAPVQLVNANAVSGDLPNRLASLLQPLGLDLAGGVQGPPRASTVVYDLSGSEGANTAAWLGDYFGAPVVQGPDPKPVPGEATTGVVVSLGDDFANRFYGS
ncbi:MAG: LCP family protein [Candidatus Dormibacteraeota bacterium]|nr:LCP family protein [Candidatus Dormibacteraeota bacterium]